MPRRGAPKGNRNATRHGGYSHTRLVAEPTAAHGSDAPGEPADSAGSKLKPKTAPLPSIADVIKDLAEKQVTLARYMCELDEGDDSGPRLAAMNLYSQNASRIARMIRYTDDLGGGEKAQRINDALNEALDILQHELSRQL